MKRSGINDTTIFLLLFCIFIYCFKMRTLKLISFNWRTLKDEGFHYFVISAYLCSSMKAMRSCFFLLNLFKRIKNIIIIHFSQGQTLSVTEIHSLSLFHVMWQDVLPLNGLENWIPVNMWLTHEKHWKKITSRENKSNVVRKRTQFAENILMSWIISAIFYLNKQFLNKKGACL